jgi:superfamily I DNA/RNA helicase
MEFNLDGSIKVDKPIASKNITKDTEYLWVLKAIVDLPFPVGKSLLIDFMTGEENNKSVSGCKLYDRPCFGCLCYTKEELGGLIDKLLLKGFISQNSSSKNKYWKIIEITKKGREELIHPTLDLNQLSQIAVGNDDSKNKTTRPFESSITKHKTVITDKDQKIFDAFGNVLSKYNDYQKKAIISNSKEMLCIAGAGSGKTTVLTKRIEFLIKYKSYDAAKILAITFTRKARREMEKRLIENGVSGVKVETFNSFCEKILLANNDLIYDKQVRILDYKDKIMLINKALYHVKLNMSRAIQIYFTPHQRMGKTEEQLVNIFRSDCFFIRDYLKFKNEKTTDVDISKIDVRHQDSANLIFSICNYLDEYMHKNGLRDYADQLIDAISFFKSSPQFIPKYDHILIDEFQDVNSTQVELIDLLNGKNIFCVGDPRQSIYGWRGSNIKYIMNFKEKYPNAEIICLNKNYRSTKPIVELFNESIKDLGLDDLENSVEGEKEIHLLSFAKEDQEFEFIFQKIVCSQIKRSEIFVLARTNKQLNKLSEFFNTKHIKHIVKSEEINKKEQYEPGDINEMITLATIHAIKGLEAEMVFVIGCNGNNFPCRTNEHPIIDLVLIDEYDKEEEERRLFYVALSRAKKHLYLTHTANPTYFISAKMKQMLSPKKGSFSSASSNMENTISSDTKNALIKNLISGQNNSSISNSSIKSPSKKILERLTVWRSKLSKKTGLPAFMILHNTTLEEIASKMPQTLRELEDINGLGPIKIQKYGEEILSCI